MIRFWVGHVSRKQSSGYIQAWTPKDHQLRTIPLPAQAVKTLAIWQSAAPAGYPYAFMEHGRWDYYRQQVDQGLWRDGQDLINNLPRRFKTICRKVGNSLYSLHDIRRSCITNWARKLPIHVVQQLAGHSDIRTTQKYYLLVQRQDLEQAAAVQQSLLRAVPDNGSSYPKATRFSRKRAFPGPQGKHNKRQLFE